MIFIARNHNGKIIGIVSAKTENSVNAYYQGKGITPHTLGPFNPESIRENEEEGYVTPILTTREVDKYDLNNRDKIFIVV